MAFIGNTNTTQAFTPAVDFFSGNGSTTAFTLSRPVASVAQVQVTIDNVAQNPSSAYTVSSNTITFTSAPLSGTNNIYVYYTSPITQVIAPGQGTVTTTSLASSTGSGAVALASLPTFTTTIGVGGATASASGSGISFPATQSASTDANTLDDYEEGTWTPIILGATGSAGAQAYSTQVGRYIKIGRFVLLTGFLTLSNKGSWTASVKIGGFPFTVTNENASYSAHAFYYTSVTLPANNFGLGAYVLPNSTTAPLFTSNNTGTTDLADYATQISNSTQMGPWQICYFTSV